MISSAAIALSVLTWKSLPGRSNGSTKSTEVVVDLAAKVVICATKDAYGNLWIGSQDQGIFCLNASSRRWARLTTDDGLSSNDATAIARDSREQVWVGHADGKLNVFDGTKWHRINLESATRIYAIATCPLNDAVWIATDFGVRRYGQASGAWSHLTACDNLPSDEVRDIGFDAGGSVYFGTANSGIEIAHLKDDYKTWNVVVPTSPPVTASGYGLASGMINDLLVTQSGTVYAATCRGISWSEDSGQSWKFIRGADWRLKAENSNDEHGLLVEDRAGLLAEDYVTCLAEAEDGELWVGYRTKGCERIKPGTWEVTATLDTSSYVTTIVPTGGGEAVVGTLGNQHILPTKLVAASPSTVKPTVAAPFPSPPPPPTTQEVKSLLTDAVQLSESGESPAVTAMSDDWQTQGDWLGRYGRYWAILCGMDGQDYLWGAGRIAVGRANYAVTIGPNHDKGDTNRYWVANLYSKERRILELPPVYLDSRIRRGMTKPELNRRDSQWDDHGEAYAYTYDGPHLYTTLKIPEGKFCLSIYQVNSNGHAGEGRYRDFRISVRKHFGASLKDISGFEQQEELASARVVDFCSGVYKRFAVNGPIELTIKVDRNYSINANITAMMLDEFTETPEPYFDPEDVRAAYAGTPADPQVAEIARLFTQYMDAYRKDPVRYCLDRGRTCAMVMRWLDDQVAQGKLKTTDRDYARIAAPCFFILHDFERMETMQRQLGLRPARDIEKALKWDERIPNNSGLGRYAVTTYLENLARAATTAPAN
jgi:hypothetical protein